MKDQILKLREEGKTYNEIQKILGCSKGTISYHCGKGQKEKTKRRQESYRKENPLSQKMDRFKQRDGNSNRTKVRNFQARLQNDSDIERNPINRKSARYSKDVEKTFSIHDVYDKFGDYPRCYLSGEPVDWSDGSTFSLDHITPVCLGGGNSLDNLEICTPEANQMKGALPLDEFFSLCKKILEYNGFEVNKKE